MSQRVRPTRSETRQRVLAAAQHVFAEHGIAASSLSQVAAAAGLTKGAVYSNFDSKDALVLALMQERADDRINVALAGFTAGAASHEEAVAQMAAALVRSMRGDASWYRLFAEYFAMTHDDPQRRDALRESRRAIRATIARVLTETSQGLGFALPLPADELAVVLMVLSNGLAMEADIDPEAVPEDLLPRVLGLIGGETTIDRLREAAARTKDTPDTTQS